MSTKKLAKELGLLRQRSQSSGSKKSLVSNQIFSYLIVIDFESTCWKEKNNYSQEIIEFPAVLLNTSSGEVESEFHTYVQPQEHPNLSKFCTELTGITQVQVEAGIPLRICLSRFCRWLQNLQVEKGLVFPNRQQRCSAPSASQKLCTFLTWSDWDLGVCLQYECKRKQLHKPDVLNSWIDLRSTYRLFYSRKPKGLNGALQDLGIQFAGREHSGLDDSRNTAQLAARMMRDGCVMKITRSLERTPPVVKPMFENTTADNNKKEKPDPDKEEQMPTTAKPSTSKPCQIKNNMMDLDTKGGSSLVQESIQICQSLISPKTLLTGAGTPLWGRSRRSVTSTTSTDTVNGSSPLGAINKSLVLCSTTLGSLSHLPQPNKLSKTVGATVQLVEDEESEELVVEEEERCGSYDDVLLDEDGQCDTEYMSDFDSGCYMLEDFDSSTEGQVISRDNTSVEKNSTNVSTHRTDQLKRTEQHPAAISEPDAYFAVPKAVTWKSKTKKQEEEGLKTSSLHLKEKSNWAPQTSRTNTPSPLRHKPFIPEKTSTPNTSFAKPKPVSVPNGKFKETPKSFFTIYTDPTKQAAAPTHSYSSSILRSMTANSFSSSTNHSFMSVTRKDPTNQAAAPTHPSSSTSLNTPKTSLRSLSANTLSSSTNHSFMSVTRKGGQRITSPLCSCGRRAKRQVVSNGGPNQGRGFYCCPVRRSGSGGRIQKGCEFFKWESSLMKSSGAVVASPAVGSSVSLCQISSAVRPQQRSTLRKSY